jgi:hypothetical protein
LLDEAPHDLTRAFNVGGSDQPSPLLPSLLRPAMVVTLHPCSLRDHDTGEPTLCISVTEHTIIVRCGSLGPSTSFTLDCVQKYVKSSDVPVLRKNNAFCTNSAEGGRPPRNADIRVQIMPPFGYGRTSVRHYRNAVAVGFPTAKPPKALATGTFAQHATTMFFPHFVGGACCTRAGLMRTGLVELIERRHDLLTIF